ncbi:MAG TPA: AAA family ATPase [Polyangium sp.]|nr:AAA family ATPase [Polyangium sp.]
MNGPFLDAVEIFDGATTRIFRALDTHTNTRVILKNIRPEHLTAHEIARLRHEYDILKNSNIPGVVKALGLAEHNGCPALVLEDRGGQALDTLLARGPLELSRALEWAVQTVRALAEIHAQRIIHKDINPHNIIVLDDGHDIELIDFELATKQPRVVEHALRPEILEGTLAYLAPEQSGRMNRAIDNRTDLYSFGATMYHVLIGHPPFQAADPLELVHAHIARKPTPPAIVRPTIPEVLSAIVMKLLAKMPEDRYQSAAGLRADLEECLGRLTDAGTIESFELGAEDVADQFRIPEHLYGRENELAQIETIYQRSPQGKAEFVLLKGPAGIGKSALIREFARSVRMSAGSFASGQFLRQDRDVPYSGIAAALAPLVKERCAASENQLAPLRRELREALGHAAGVVTEVVPEVALLLGKTPPKPVELPADQARERAKFAFVQLFQVLARDGLALFLDDLQWADIASLELLAHLVADVGGKGIVILASAREEDDVQKVIEPFEEHLASKGAVLTTLALKPSSIAAVRALVFDTVGGSRGSIADSEIDALAELIHRRTLGNPLFVATFLNTLHRDGFIDFDHDARAWTWKLSDVETAQVPGDVAQLLSERAAKLAPRTREILQTAACIGTEFQTNLLSSLTGLPEDDIEQSMVESADEGLIYATGQAYAFVHERVREALLQDLDPQSKKTLHWRIGRVLRSEARGDKLFIVLGHVNVAADLVMDARERLDLARLNLEGAQRARAIAAFDAASTYFEAGTSFLPRAAFDTVRDLAWPLALGAAESAYSCRRKRRAEEWYEQLELHAKSELEKLEIAGARVRMHRVLNEYGAAKNLALETLPHYGLTLPKTAGIPKVLLAFGQAERMLSSRKVEDLLALPLAPRSRKNDLWADLMEDALFTVYFEDPLLHSVMTAKIITRTLTEGISAVSPACFAAYALLVRLIRGQAIRANEMCQMALQLAEKFPGLPTALIRYIQAMLIMPFAFPFRQSVEKLGEVYQTARAEGNRIFMHLALGPYVGYPFHAGVPIPEYLANFSARERELDELADASNNARSHRLLQRIALYLQGKTKAGSFETEELDDATFLADLQRDPMKLAAPLYNVNRAWAHLVMGDHAEAKRLFDLAPSTLEEILGAVYTIGEFLWLRATVQLTNMPRSRLARAKALIAVRLDLRKIVGYAEHCREGFGHLAELLKAELARVEGRTQAAADHYENASQLAREQGFLQYEAYAEEQAARYWWARKNDGVARSYMQRAYRAYQIWGATLKIAALEREFPWLERVSGRSSRTTTSTVRGTQSTTSTSLDARSMVLASQAISEEIALDKLLQKLMTVIVQATGATRAALVLDTRSGFVVVAQFAAEQGAQVLARPERLDSSENLPVTLVQYVLRTGKPLLTEDANEHDIARQDPYVRTRSSKSLLLVPMLRHGVTRGTLYLENDALVGVFDAARMTMCEVLLAQVSISIDNAQMYGDLEKLVDERTQALEGARARVVELEKNATEAQMAGGFAHEMRNALTAAKMLLAAVHFKREGAEPRSLCLENAEVLFDMYNALEKSLDAETLDALVPTMRQLNANEEKIHNVLGMIADALERALGTTGTILEYSRLSAEVAGQTLIEVRYLVDSLREETLVDLENCGISLAIDVPEGSQLRGNDVHFHSILKNLVLNARDALLDVDRPEGRRIRVLFEEHQQDARFVVEDNGSGIDPSVAERVFEPFVSTKPVTGTGLGLGVVRKLTALYGGRIHFETEVGRGTRFVVTLPRRQLGVNHE